MENEETKASASDATEESKKDVVTQKETSEEHIDYKAELERERQRNERLGKDLEKKNKKLSEAFERNDEIEKEREEELYSRLEQRIEERLQGATKVVNENYARDLAQQMAQGEADLAELVYLKYKNRIVPSGSLHEDMQEAYFLATGGKFRDEAQEAKRTALSKTGRGNGAGAGQKRKEEPDVELTPEELKLLKFGVSIEELKKAKQQ